VRFHLVGFISLAGIGAGIIGATVLTPLLTVPVLSVIGFSAAGPVAGKGRLFLTRRYRLVELPIFFPTRYTFCVTGS